MTDEIVIGGDAADIPPGTYQGKLVSVLTKESKAFGEFRAWDFELATGSIVGGASSMNTGSKSKAGKWIASLLGRKPEKGEAVLAKILDKPCTIVVGLNDQDWPTVTDVLPPMDVIKEAIGGPAAIPAPHVPGEPLPELP